MKIERKPKDIRPNWAVRPKTVLIVMGAILFIFISLTLGAYFLVQKQVLTGQIEETLQKSIEQSHLQIKIQKIHVRLPLVVTATGVQLTEFGNGLELIQADRVNIKFNLLELLFNPRHPESCVRDIEIIKPLITLERIGDYFWNFQRYVEASNDIIKLKTMVHLRDGLIKFHDFQFGTFKFTALNGKINLTRFPLVQWKLETKSQLGLPISLSSRGEMRADQIAGSMKVFIRGSSLPKVMSYFPKVFDYRVVSGIADIDLELGFHGLLIWMENGKALIKNANVYLPYFADPLRVKYLETTIDPKRLQINKAELTYHQTTITAHGTFNPNSTIVKGGVKMKGLDLEEIIHFMPELKNYGIEGILDLALNFSGRISAPVLDGVLTLADGKIGLGQGEFLEGISGRVAVRQNSLFIKQLGGFWRQSPLEITGNVENVFNPFLNLTISGKGLNLNRLEMLQTVSKDWQVGNQINFQAAITGSPLKPNLTGVLTSDEFRFQGIMIQRLKVDFAWNMAANNLGANIQGEIGVGRLNAKGTVRFDPQVVEWSITGDLSELDLGQFSLGPDLKLLGRISASIVTQGSWRQGEQVNFGKVFGTFRSESLTFQNYKVNQAEGVLSWSNQNLTIDSFQAKTNQERIFGSLKLIEKQLMADFDVENIQLRRLPLDRKKLPIDGVLNGSVVLEGPLTRLHGRVNGTIANFAWGSQKIGAITGSLLYSNNTVNVLDLTAVTEAGNITAQGSITVAAKPVIKLSLASNNAKMAGILKWLSLDPSLKLDGSAQAKVEIEGSLDDPSLKGEIALFNPQLFNRKMKEGLIQFEGNLAKLRLRKFSLSNDSSQLELSGWVNQKDFDLQITGKSLDLAILQLGFGGKSLQGILNLNGKLAGSFKAPVLTGAIAGQDLKFGSLFYPEMTGKMIWNKEGLEILEAGLRQEQSSITMKGRILSSNPARFDLEAKVQNFKIQDIKQFVTIPAGLNVEGQINGDLKLTGTNVQPSIQAIGTLSQGKVNSIPVTGDFNLFYSNNRIILNQIQLRLEEGTLNAIGIWENNKSLKMQIRIMNFPVEVFNAFLKLPYAIGGVVNSQIDLEWSLERVVGKYRVEGVNFSLNQDPLGDILLAGVISETGLTVDEGTLTGKNGSIIMNGYLPLPQKLPNELGLPAPQPSTSRELDFNLNINQVSGTLLNHYLQNVTVLSGICNGQFQLKGALSQPVVSGALKGEGFKVDIGGLAFPMEVPEFDLSVEDNRVLLPKLKGVYGTGKFTVEGQADFHNLKELSFKINTTGTRIYLRNQFFDGFGDLNLNLKGTLKDTLLSGNITVYENKVGVLGVEPGGPVSIGWNPKLDLVIKAGNNSRCRVIGFADVEIKGLLRIKGTLAAPTLEGEVNSKSGVLTFYNNAFRINEGKAVFKYSQGLNPYLEIEAGVRKSNVEVFLSIKGIINQLDIRLSSQPFLSDTELYSLLNWSQLHGDEPLTPQDMVAGNLSILTDTLMGDFLSTLGQTLNVDYLYLEPDSELKGFRIIVGNYVTPQLFLSYSQSIFNSDQSYQWSLDYYLSPNWVLGYNYSIQEGDSWELAYRIKF